jgi:signal transduction histidine kinase
MQKEFINVAAHELRTPTQGITGNLELIEMIHLPSLLQDLSKNLNITFRIFSNSFFGCVTIVS